MYLQAGDQGRQLLKDSFNAVAARHAEKAAQAGNCDSGRPPCPPVHDEMRAGGMGPHQRDQGVYFDTSCLSQDLTMAVPSSDSHTQMSQCDIDP